MRYLLALVLTVGCVTAGCGLLTEPAPYWPSNVYAITPDTAYTTYWHQMEECSGLRAHFARVSWFRADSLLDYPGLGAFGLADWRQHRIALDGRYLRDAVTIRHEMLHELLQRDGHPEDYFGLKCGGLLSH